ncbi:MAG: polysaccharide biosynthesis/export family protein [Deltaproteobacteria bacterium]|nr:polysaccharide biosynthesis/export family protein [Deltaproteobacteria bacterium]MCL5276411.1 polysaccharide biosynthesis/export family protein [Deltaproteobacteria bacterium]
MRVGYLLLLIPFLIVSSCAAPNSEAGHVVLPGPAPVSSDGAEGTGAQHAGLQRTGAASAIPIAGQDATPVAGLFQKDRDEGAYEGLGPGDEISVTVWGHPDISGVARIERDGRIYLPLVGGVYAKGLTPGRLKDKLTKDISEYIKHPLIDVEVKEYASRLVLILGSVARPGIYPLRGGTDIVTAIALAGGQAQQSNLSNIYLLRRGHSTIVNVADYIRTGSAYNDPVLENKDVVYVPSAEEQNVIVLGRVDRPVVIPVAGAPMSIVKAIVLAGGFKNGALKNDVKVIRGGLIHPDIYTVNLDDILHGKRPGSAQGLSLYAGDIVFVPQSGIATWNDILEQIQPTMDLLLAKPLSIATNYLLLRQLLRYP